MSQFRALIFSAFGFVSVGVGGDAVEGFDGGAKAPQVMESGVGVGERNKKVLFSTLMMLRESFWECTGAGKKAVRNTMIKE